MGRLANPNSQTVVRLAVIHHTPWPLTWMNLWCHKHRYPLLNTTLLEQWQDFIFGTHTSMYTWSIICHSLITHKLCDGYCVVGKAKVVPVHAMRMLEAITGIPVHHSLGNRQSSGVNITNRPRLEPWTMQPTAKSLYRLWYPNYHCAVMVCYKPVHQVFMHAFIDSVTPCLPVNFWYKRVGF